MSFLEEQGLSTTFHLIRLSKDQEASRMLTYEDARKIGVDACINKLGRAFVQKYRDSSTSGGGDREDHAYCYVGVDDRPAPVMKDELFLTSDNPFPYIARCTVRYCDGHVDFLDCVLPS